MKKKALRIVVCLLLILPVFSFTTVADPSPDLNIKIIGSLPFPYLSNHVGGVILNSGDATAYNISYILTIKGGFGETISETNQDYEYEILPHNAFAVGIVGTHGFGPVIITLTASATNAENVTGTTKGFQIGGFTWIPLSWFSIFIND
jgi:hypothetical protein